MTQAQKKHVKKNTWTNKIICNDAWKELRRMPNNHVDVTITSPPYYRQRNYGGDAELGQEPTIEDYVRRIAAVFYETLRVTKPTGSLWLVLGDKYVNGALQGMPWRVALALVDAGWILRSDVIWHKPNAMPSSTKTRPTTDHEYVFFFTKSKNYFYDADSIREPHVTFSENSKMKGGRRHFGQRGGTPEQGKNGGNSNLHDGRWDQAFHPKGRNKRTVWSIPLSKFRDAHFAVFPESLVETCINASCPKNGLAMDPFSGSGTVAMVAKRMERNYLGIDCLAEFCQMGRKRVRD